jgi:hypothetical protein
MSLKKGRSWSLASFSNIHRSKSTSSLQQLEQNGVSNAISGYIGETKGGKRHGYGRMTFENGVYEGNTHI